jgi:hypothetical protein
MTRVRSSSRSPAGTSVASLIAYAPSSGNGSPDRVIDMTALTAWGEGDLL